MSRLEPDCDDNPAWWEYARLWERRKALRFSALRVLTGNSWAYLKVLQTAYKQLQLTEF
jgi:hypothetical protein